MIRPFRYAGPEKLTLRGSKAGIQPAMSGCVSVASLLARIEPARKAVAAHPKNGTHNRFFGCVDALLMQAAAGLACRDEDRGRDGWVAPVGSVLVAMIAGRFVCASFVTGNNLFTLGIV